MSPSSMPYRPMGRCGLRLSALSLGGWTTFGGSVTGEGEIREILRTAFDAGVNFFDIADVYARGEAELVMGRVLADLPRHELVISSKVFFPMSDDVNDRGLSRKHVFESVHRSLKRIGTSYLDLYFCHRFDPDTPLEETVRAMDDLVRQGKILYWGTSEWSGAQIREVTRLCRELGAHPPRAEQPQYSLLVRSRFEHEVRAATEECGMGVVSWSPLASGLLTGKYDAGLPPGSRLQRIDWLRDDLLEPDRVARVRRLKALAESVGCTRAQLALAWLLRRPGLSSVILGATGVEQLRENLGALEVDLDDAIAARVERLFPAD